MTSQDFNKDSPHGEHTDPRVPLLVSALMSTAADVRMRARRAMVRLGKPALSPLVRLLSDRRKYVRWDAAKCLAEIADPEAAPALVCALEDKDSGVRWVAAEGLIAMGDASLKATLEAIVERPDSLWLREGVHHVLHELCRRRSCGTLSRLRHVLDGVSPEVEAPAVAKMALNELEEEPVPAANRATRPAEEG